MSEQLPTLGRIVHYRLKADEAEHVNRRRTTPSSIFERIKVLAWPLGAQAHIGFPVAEGDTFPMIVTYPSAPLSAPDMPVNGQVFLDGTDVLWVSGVKVGEGPGTFSWPTRA